MAAICPSLLSPSQPHPNFQPPPPQSPPPLLPPFPSISLSKAHFPFPKTKPKLLSKSHPFQSPITHLTPHLQSEPFTNDYFNLLRLSIRYGHVEFTKTIHASILKFEEEDVYLVNALIAAYLKLGFVVEAYKVFLGLSNPNVVSYTAMISGFAKSNREFEAMEMFMRMRSSGIEPNEYTFVAILTACVKDLDLKLVFQIHGLVIKMVYLDDTYVANSLLGLYSKCGRIDTVNQVFDEMSVRDIVSWNTVISSLVKEMIYDKAFELFHEMKRVDGLRADQFSLSTILTASAGSLASNKGREIHCHALKSGFESNLSVSNALIGFYTKCGRLEDVVNVFKLMPVKDAFTWTEMIMAYMEFGLVDLAVEIFEKMPDKSYFSYNALLSGFYRNGIGSIALNLFIKMVQEGVEMTDSTLTSVVNACGLLMELKLSEQIHGFLVKFGIRSNACIEAALIDMCTRCGRMADAQKLLSQQLDDRNDPVMWTSMLCGYARDGQPEAALSLFNLKLSKETMVIDEVESSAILGVCGTLGFHNLGKQIHCNALKSEFRSDLELRNTLISMYSKCGNINDSIKVFNTMDSHDIVSWNSLITSHLLHRQGDEALAVWANMQKKGLKPDQLTLFLIISSYKHTEQNLVDHCRIFFSSMKTSHNVELNSEHYMAFVGSLGRWGFLEEAGEVINNMPFDPTATVWRALLDSSRIHKNKIIGKQVTKRILDIKPQDPSTYILVSNLYSASGRWYCSETVREKMIEEGFKKNPSRCWIVFQNKVHSFFTRDKSHLQTKDIYSGIEILILECMKAGYVPDTSYVLHEVEEHHKKEFLFYHSAKLAVTYGLLMSKPGKPIRVSKNIHLCGDCHTFMKYVSVVARREIILRDASGFHCFSNGLCSCKDNW